MCLHTLHGTKKDPYFSEFVGKKKKWFMLGFNLPIIIMCKWVLDSLAFTLYGEHGCCCQQRHMSSSRPICCLGSAWLTQIYFISFFNLATFSLFSLSLLGFILFTSLLFSFVPCREDEEANNGNSVFSKCSPCPWESFCKSPYLVRDSSLLYIKNLSNSTKTTQLKIGRDFGSSLSSQEKKKKHFL